MECRERRQAAKPFLCSLQPFLGVATMFPLLIVGVFMLGAGSGGLCVFLQQRGIRARFHKEITDQLDQALFGHIRQWRQ